MTQRNIYRRYKLIKPEKRSWGGPKPDGTVTGLVGQVFRREADMAIDLISINSERKSILLLKIIMIMILNSNIFKNDDYHV